MFTDYIEQHIKIIRKNVDIGLIVYKGFPLKFVKEVSKYFSPLSDISKIDDGGKINIQYLQKGKKELVTQFLSMDKIYISTYEELVLLARSIDPSLLTANITIVENTLFNKIYPNPSNLKCYNYDQEIDKSDKFKPSKDFSSVYSHSSIVNGTEYVTYKDIDKDDFEDISYIDFYKGLGKPKKLKISAYKDDQNYIEIPGADNSFLTFRTSLYQNQIPKSSNFLISENLNSLNSENYLNELLVISLLYKKRGIKLRISEKTEQFQDDYRVELNDLLRNYWNSNNFRTLSFYKNPDVENTKIKLSQASIVEFIIQQSEKSQDDGTFQDVFLTAPTGSGKSLLFQMPAFYLAEHHNLMTIVISPLKALMYDQISALKGKGIENADFINSDVSFVEREKTIERIKEGDISILYLSPELLLSYNITEFIGDRKLGLLVIDEAHLVTTWGRDFRVDYWYLGKYIRSLRKYSDHKFPIISFTATAVYGGESDIVFQTIESLNMQLPKIYLGDVRRDDINFSIKPFKHKGSYEESKMEHTAKKINKNSRAGIKSIYYFPWTRQIDHLSTIINAKARDKTGRYYGSVDKTERLDVINRFKDGNINGVLATKAFGLGVDIDDIKEIYHHAPSGDLSDYIQEIGRAARATNIEGTAVVDFSPKDLKYTRILYGLSSIKQYQIKLTIKKIYDIYKIHKKQNLLFSVEDFQYIFPNANNSDSKVKSCLLLIENDLINKYGYNVVIVRPKSLYTTIFAEIPKNIEPKFIKQYGKYCKRISIPLHNRDYETNIGEGIRFINRGSENNFYKISFDKLWQKHFSDESFPMTKKKYFDRTLFNIDPINNPIPLSRLKITLEGSVDQSISLLIKYLNAISTAFSGLVGHYFTKSQFENALMENIPDRLQRQRISDLILNTYSKRAVVETYQPGLNYDDLFLQHKLMNGKIQYRVLGPVFIRVSKNTIRKFREIFYNNVPLFEMYLRSHSKKGFSLIKLAHILESFHIGSYEFVGGTQPQIFVRINDPYKLGRLSNDIGYNNEILKDIDNRHSVAMEIMESFFTSTMKSKDRWNLIEEYFLGVDVSEFEL